MSAIQREAMQRLRLKFHQQHLSVEQPLLSSASQRLVSQTRQLSQLRTTHKVNRTQDAATKARSILTSIRPFAVDDDPNFVHAQRILRAAAYFKCSELPIVASLVELHLRHTFLLDAQAAASFVTLLRQLRIANLDELLQTLYPRVVELGGTFNTAESVIILTAYGGEEKLADIVGSHLLRYGDDLPVSNLLEVVESLFASCPEQCRILLARRSEDVVNYVQQGHSEDVMVLICRSLSTAGAGLPRNVVNAVADVVLSSSARCSPAAAAVYLDLQRASSHRHERLTKRLCTELLTSSASTAAHALSALSCLAHFYIGDSQLVVSLLQHAEFTSDQFVEALWHCHTMRVVSPPLYASCVKRTALACTALPTVSLARVVICAAAAKVWESAVAKEDLSAVLRELASRQYASSVTEMRLQLLSALEEMQQACHGKPLALQAEELVATIRSV